MSAANALKYLNPETNEIELITFGFDRYKTNGNLFVALVYEHNDGQSYYRPLTANCNKLPWNADNMQATVCIDTQIPGIEDFIAQNKLGTPIGRSLPDKWDSTVQYPEYELNLQEMCKHLYKDSAWLDLVIAEKSEAEYYR